MTSSGPAPVLPIARVAVDVPLAHLDRPFDYAVPAAMHDLAVAGCRVKVRFAGRDVNGFLLERTDETEHVGQLAWLRRVVSSEPVLTPAVLAASRAVADRYAGCLADVLRFAVPPRHARVEAAPATTERPGDTGWSDPGGDLARYPARDLARDLLGAARACWSVEVGGRGLVERLAAGDRPRAVWTAYHASDWPHQLAAAAVATLSAGRGTVLCAPTGRDVLRVDAALRAHLGADHHVVLTADLGPAARYRAFLAMSRGRRQIVVGTRAAALAPVRDLGLVAMWDDGDDLYAEPHAPYPHAREILVQRSFHESTAALLGSFSRSVEAQALVESGWAVALGAPREVVRRVAPRIHVTGESDRDVERDPVGQGSRMPRQVFETVRAALSRGPVIVHNPSGGYDAALVCESCRRSARCGNCGGPLLRGHGGAVPQCRWCGRVATDWRCEDCGAARVRGLGVGSLRTAAEWGRAFPQTSVLASGGEHVVDEVGSEPVIVIATPGAEPRALRGYAAAVLLDTGLSLGRPDLRAGEESVRRWFEVAALVRSGAEDGRVIAVGDPSRAPLQALVRSDPVGFAARELADRRSARLTPAARVATITAPRAVVETLTRALDLPAGTDVLGPVELRNDASRLVLRAPLEQAAALSRALQQLQATRSARKLSAVRVQVDPTELT